MSEKELHTDTILTCPSCGITVHCCYKNLLGGPIVCGECDEEMESEWKEGHGDKR